MDAMTRLFRFVIFTLTEYMRSGRILIEILVTLAAFYILFRSFASSMSPEYFFSAAGLLVIGMTFYTTSSMMGLGDRPQGYLVLTRRLGRTGYLIGLYLSALLIELAIYGLISLGVALTNPIVGIDLVGWVLGTIPLILNVALLGAILTLLAPMVLTAGGRLAILAIVAIAFSGNLLSGQTVQSMWPPLRSAIEVFRTIFSAPLLPAFTGFALSVSRNYEGFYGVVPLAQLLLTLGLLGLALYAFRRREIIFTSS